jgi:hypothetical protein
VVETCEAPEGDRGVPPQAGTHAISLPAEGAPAAGTFAAKSGEAPEDPVDSERMVIARALW